MASQVRVVKVGGSLLDLPKLESRLAAWLDGATPVHQVLVVGGGKLVEEVRRWDSQSPLDEETAHWLCVDLMSTTSQLLQSRLPNIPIVGDICALNSRLDLPGATFFDVATWLREEEPHLPGRVLPASWAVTSDAIAARLAIALGAEELVLLKSCLPCEETGYSLPELVESGMVDSAMGWLADELPPVRIVNMRANPLAETVIRTLEPDSGNL